MRAQGLGAESPLARLHRPARDRGTQVAVIERGPDAWLSLTWNELLRHVIDGAAGMIEAGVNPGQIVVIRVPTGIRQLELELATRVAGAVPLLLPDHMDQHEVGRLLDEIEVRLVVVDHARRLTLLRRSRLTEAQLFECDDRSWERLRGMGLDRRKREPDVLLRADAVRDGAHSGTVLGLPREKSLAWLFRPEASGALSDLTADDVVLLTGEATDRFTTVVRDAHLRAGCTMVWVETPDQVEAALVQISPTHVFLDHVTAKALEGLLVGATVDGSPWHETPQEVLDAASARAADARLNARTKRLAADVTTLAPWWGGRLRQLVLDTRVNRTVTGLAAALDFQIGRIAHHPAVKLDLAHETRVAAVAVAAAPVTVTAPESVPARSEYLPRRARSGLDSAFSLAGLPGS